MPGQPREMDTRRNRKLRSARAQPGSGGRGAAVPCSALPGQPSPVPGKVSAVVSARHPRSAAGAAAGAGSGRGNAQPGRPRAAGSVPARLRQLAAAVGPAAAGEQAGGPLCRRAELREEAERLRISGRPSRRQTRRAETKSITETGGARPCPAEMGAPVRKCPESARPCPCLTGGGCLDEGSEWRQVHHSGHRRTPSMPTAPPSATEEQI